jgi:hypothetical protein
MDGGSKMKNPPLAFSLAALAGVTGFATAVAALHRAAPSLSPLTEAVSYYAHGPHGEWLTVGLLALGLGSVALARAFATTLAAPGSGLVRASVLTWGICVTMGGLLPADPPGHWSEPPSVGGLIHGGAALLGFLALPIGAIVLARGLHQDPRWRPVRAPLGWLARLCVLTLGLFVASLAPTLGAERPPVLLGLTERLLLAAYVAWLGGCALWAARLAALTEE